MITTVSGLSIEIYNDLNPPSGFLDTGYIQSWLINNIDNLNIRIQTCYFYDFTGAITSGFTGIYSGLSGDFITGNYETSGGFITDDSGNPLTGALGEYLSGFSGLVPNPIGFTPDLSGIDKAIYKELFNVAYWQRGINSSLGAASYDTWLEIREFDSSIKRINKNELVKTYVSLLKNSQDNLKYIINQYQKIKAVPLQVVGTDAIPGIGWYATFYRNYFEYRDGFNFDIY